MKYRIMAVTIAAFLSTTSIAIPNTAPTTQNDCQAGINSAESENCLVAINQLTNCLAVKLPATARALVLQARAQCYSSLKQPELAIKDQKTSLEIEPPKNVWPLVMLGAYYRELKQYDLSLAALKEALKYDEDGPGTGPGMAVYYHTGKTLHAAGRYAEAIDAYTLGIPKQPDYAFALYRRALSFEALGNRVQAKQDLVRAAELEPKEGYEEDIKAKFVEYGISVKGNKH